MNYYILKDDVYVIPDTYSYEEIYYKKTYNLLDYNNKIIASFEWQNNNQPICYYKNNDLNNLLTYKYIPDSPILLQDLYVYTRIENTGDIIYNKKDGTNNKDLINRTATNKYLYDIRDLTLLAKNKKIYISFEKNIYELLNEKDIIISYDENNKPIEINIKGK